MAMPAPADATAATPTATPQATHSAPTQGPPQTQTRAEATAGDQHMAPLTAGMPASSAPGADAAALSSQTPSEQPQPAQEREVPQEQVMARSTSDAMDTS